MRVDQAYVTLAKLGERGCDIVDFQRDVVQPGPRVERNFEIGESGDVACNSSSDDLPAGYELSDDPLRRDLFRRRNLEPQRVTEKGERLVKVGDRNADVIQCGFQ